MILGDSHRASVADHVGKSLHRWSENWTARVTAVREISLADTASMTRWVVVETGPLHAVGVGCSRAWFDEAANIFAGAGADASAVERPSDFTHALCDAALEELALLLCGPNGRVRRHPPGIQESMEARGSGFLGFGCQFEESTAEIQIIGWPEWVAALRDSSGHRGSASMPVTPVENALGSESVLVSAIIGEAELPISEFARLAIGDVLVVDRRLQEPLTVHVEGGEVFAGGHLCAAQGSRAIELLPAST